MKRDHLSPLRPPHVPSPSRFPSSILATLTLALLPSLLHPPLSPLLSLCRYLKERQQFGTPLAAFQLNQEKLVRMLGNIQAMVLMVWRLSTLHETGRLTAGHASMTKVSGRAGDGA